MINFHVNCFGSLAPIHRITNKCEGILCGPGKRKGCSSAGSSSQTMVADRIMEGRIQGEGVKVKGLPVAGNAAIGDNFFKPPPGSARCAFGKLVNRKKLHMGYFK